MALPPAPDVARHASLVNNGGFERGEAFPDFWVRHPRENNGRNLHLRDTTLSHSGAASGKLVYLDDIEGPNKAPVQWMKYGIRVEGGSGVLVAGWVRTEGVSNGRVGIHIYDRERNHLGFRPIPHPPGTDQGWRPFEQVIDLPTDAATIGVALYAERGGTTWYDDVAVIGTPEADAVRGTPRLDGVLDDAVWTESPPITAFMRHTGEDTSREPTKAWIAYDDSALYIAFHCPHRPGATLKLDARQRDGDTWLDDSVEVFLDPDHDHRTYVQFCVNAAGLVRDSRGRNAAWNSTARAQAQQNPEAWSVELAIPFADLELTLQTDTVWGVNLVRNDRVNGETVTWSLGGFHVPTRFGNVRLDPDLSDCLQPALSRELDRLATRAGKLRKELGDAKVGAADAPKAFAHLQQLERSLAKLRAERAPGGWRELRSRVASLDALISRSRAAAVEALYRDVENAEFAVRIAGSLQKVRREGTVADAILTREVHLQAARDEVESFQLIVIPGTAEGSTLSVAAPPLQGAAGAVPLSWNVVEYVETATPRGYTAPHVGWWPDILLPPGLVEVQQGRRRPLWFRAEVPPDAAPGLYTGQVTLSTERTRIDVPVTLRVRAFRLPRPGALPCAFGLYASALSSYYHGKKPYRDVMSTETYRRWVDFMGSYRLTPKNVANEYHDRRQADGRDLPDLSNLNGLLAEPAPALFPPYSFCMFRLPCPKDWRDGEPKQDPGIALEKLSERVAEYARLKLPEQAYVYGIDEPAPRAYPFVRAIYERVRRVAPGFPIMQTVNGTVPDELSGLVDIWCPLSARLHDGARFYRSRLNAGDTLWLYVCCSPKPPYANFFVDEPAIDHRVLFWQARQAGATGVLYWCVCWWDGLPGPNSGKTAFPATPIRFADHLRTYRSYGVNGDGLLIWPGPNMTPYPSVRLEVIRDGIEDYEYLALLSRCVEGAAALPEQRRPATQVLANARKLCTVPAAISESFISFTKDRSVLLAQRAAVANAIEELLPHLDEPPPPRPCFGK